MFSPKEELEKIKKLPRDQKKESLLVFKENFERQRQALATLRIFIERSIEFNPDTPKEKLMEIIEWFDTNYGFDNSQRKIIEQIIDEYYRHRQAVLKIRKRFPDDYELVNFLTGVNLEGEEPLEVSVGPITIEIETDAFTAGRLYERSEKPIPGFYWAGFASQSSGRKPIFYIVINRDEEIRRTRYPNDPSGEKTRKHERTHQINTILKRVLKFPEPPQFLTNYMEEKDPEIRKNSLEIFFRESVCASG